jgi:hypothetical protein
MTEVDLESDEFLSLLIEALRAGPGSPSWHDAIGRLRAGGIEHADEYRLLVRAREHLESGKSYRSLRAGPGFTQKLMSSIEQEAARGPGTPTTTTTVAVVSAAIMLAVLCVIGYLLWNAEKPPATPDGNVLLVDTATEAGFDGPLPSDWRIIGSLPIEFSRSAMRRKLSGEASGTGGGVTWSTAIAPDVPFAVVAKININKSEEDLIAQVFVTDQPEFSDDKGTTPHELLWLLQGHQMQVIIPSGRVVTQSDQAKDQRSITVSVTVDRDQASVNFGSKQERLWSGAHGLESGKPRYVGVRFLTRSKSAGDGVAFGSVRVNMRQK